MRKTLTAVLRRARTLASALAVAGAVLLLAIPALAEQKTVTLSVPGMTCAACPVTVKKALSKVTGVEKVEVSLERKEAVVTYDTAKTNVAALKQASEKAGYPASEKR